MGEVMTMQGGAVEPGEPENQSVRQVDDLCNACSLVALLGFVASQPDGMVGEDARHGAYLVGCQVESLLSACIDRERALRG